MTTQRTTLYQWHVAHGGRMVPFAGWEMPVQYPTGPIEEHHLTRRSAGLFDIAHMGQLTVSGPEAVPFLNHVLTNDISPMQDFQARYSLMCYEHGGIVDDTFIYKLPGSWLIVVNAANRAKDYEWLQRHCGDFNISLTDISAETCMLALQGPRAIELLQTMVSTDLNEVTRFTALQTIVNGVKMTIGRTGYTGEDGVELFFPAAYALPIWEAILNGGAATGIEVGPIGLAARDSLRFEAGFALYGHEIDADITPLEARLGWTCHFDKPFIGREALLTQKENGVQKKLIAFELTERGMPRQGYTVAAGADPLGEVVTGLYAPTVDRFCGHAFVPPAYTEPGTALNIIIRDKPKAAQVVKRPFYTPVYRT